MLPNIQPFLNESERKAFAEGKAEGEAAGLLKILARRGLEMTDGERARILSTRDLSLLDRWYEVALSVASVRELFELEAVQPRLTTWACAPRALSQTSRSRGTRAEHLARQAPPRRVPRGRPQPRIPP